MSAKAKQAAKQKIAALSYPTLLERQEEIQSRLKVISVDDGTTSQVNGSSTNGAANAAGYSGATTGGGKRGRRRRRASPTPPAPATVTVTVPHSKDQGGVQNAQDSNTMTTEAAATATATSSAVSIATEATTSSHVYNKIPYNIKSEVQWDYLLAEMKWLSADFQSERKRQVSLAKKQSSSIRQYIKTKEKRKMKQLVEFELKRRKLSNRIMRDVMKGWWDNKINRIIAYKQKVDSELVKKRSMDRHLIQLVKQTERYTDSLTTNQDYDSNHDHKSNDHRRRSQSRNNLSIEEALARGEIYDDSASDNNNNNSNDRESNGDVHKGNKENVHKGNKENENDDENDNITAGDDRISTTCATRTRPRRKRKIKAVQQYELDDRSDHDLIDDTESESEQHENGSKRNEEEEFKPTHNEVDDETTIEAEEKLGRDMTYEDEINLLTKENEMSIEELKALYYRGNIKNNELEVNGKKDENNNSDSNDEAFQSGEEQLQKEEVSTSLKNTKGNEKDVRIKSDNISSNGQKLRIRDTSLKPTTNINTSKGDDNVDENAPVTKETSPTYIDALYGNDKNDKPKVDDEVEEEYKPVLGGDLDDETTIEAEEKLGRDISYEDEINLLTKENEMSIEELKAMYYGAMSKADDHESEHHVADSDKNNTSMDIDIHDESQKPINTSRNQTDEDISIATDAGVDEAPMVDPFSINDDTPEDEFTPTGLNDVDDETTIEAEERLGRDISYEDEIDLLKRENEMSIEDLKAMYFGSSDTKMNKDIHDKAESDGNASDATSMISNNGESDDDEFKPINGENEVDDETTIEAEERLGREMSVEDEINLLKRESEMSVEDLRAMYLNTDENESSHGKRKDEGSQCDDENDHVEANGKRMRLDRQNGTDEAAEAMRSLELADAKARNTAVSRPFLLAPWVKLRAYQQIGLNWLVSTQTRRLNAILADEMGLGKTLQTISLLSYLACYKGIWGPHLIIVPTSCIVNWEMELKRFAPGLKVLCYYGAAKRRKELRQGWTKTNWHHVIITSYQIVVQDSFAFKRKKWYYLILDEAHNIKNFQSQRWQTLVNFNTQRRLLLTGTPLQNNLMELWSLLHFLMPYIFRSRKEFSQWFSNPMNNIIEGNANRNDDLISRLHGIIRPFVLRRLKKDVETQMPGKFEHIVKCNLSRRQMFLYEEFMARSSTRMALQKGSNYMGMMNVLMQLRKVCNHPDLFEPRSIITPLFTERLSITTAGCVAAATGTKSPFDQISPRYLFPIWTLGCGIPSMYSAVRQDRSVSSRVKELQASKKDLITGFMGTRSLKEQMGSDDLKPGLRRFLTSIWDETNNEKKRSAEAKAKINTLRCEDEIFLLPSSTLRAVTVEPKIPSENKYHDLNQIRIASTPKELLAMKRSQEEREHDMQGLLNKFLFYVPKAGSKTPEIYAKTIDSKLMSENSPLTLALSREIEVSQPSFKKTNAPFFPDKKLVQFDAGKLQTLAELLRSLKLGNHRVLIFTQMSKMLDILETFLNLNGHTYLRLDGSTGVEQRQRLMDRFNNDEKMFCFILSTRSGGLGINLTGADTVVFYDSDWNPAMDAQAQDRAHRIGQTRDVHIYRLVTQHTIEENILVKAKQKRHLDFLVMDEGKFHAAAPENATKSSTVEPDNELAECDVTTKSGLRSILGLESDDAKSKSQLENETEQDGDMSKEDMESAMAKLEDEDDILAMRGAQKEAAEELQEFDEGIKVKADADNDNDGNDQNSQDEPNNEKESKKGATSEVESEEAKLEKEFADWQRQVGADKASIDASLNPVERYALRFREEIDPFYSMWYLSDQQREKEAELLEDEIDIEEIEATKALEEQNAIEDGDLLATLPSTFDLPRQRNVYHREKSRIHANKKRRKLTGENWSTQIDGRTKLPFWYNSDTGEAVWDKPKILNELHEEEIAQERLWNAVPIKPLIMIMKFLVPYPERMICASVCRQWRLAAQDISFVRHVYPVEMGALTMDPNKMESNHYRSINEALLEALPGDTIELGDGHYWLNDPEVFVKCPLRIIGDEKDPSHVVIEVTGSIHWDSSSGYVEGVTLRRPRISSIGGQNIPSLLNINNGGNITMTQCVVEGNSGSQELILNTNSPSGGNGIIIKDNGRLVLIESQVSNNLGAGILHNGKETVKIKIDRSTIRGNKGPGILLNGESIMEVTDSDIRDNIGGSIKDNRFKDCDEMKIPIEASEEIALC